MKLSLAENVPLSQYTTLKVGGTARYFYTLSDESDLPLLADMAEDVGVPILVIGSGSNLLIADGVLERLVVKNELMGEYWNKQDNGEFLVTVFAGEDWDSFVERTVKRGLSGLENLSGVPGTVGAAPIQNINCYGSSVAESIESVTAFDLKDKQTKTLSAEECSFAYRDSIFKQPAGASLVVVKVTFRLAPAGAANLTYRSASQSIEKYLQEKNVNKPTVADVREAILHARKNIGMLVGNFRSAGSFFKNTIVSQADFDRIKNIVNTQFPEQSEQFFPWYWPLEDGRVKISTAFFLECTEYNKTAFAGKRWNKTVGISPVHSLSIVTEEGATAKDVKEFSELIIEEVKKIFGVTIESEVNFVN